MIAALRPAIELENVAVVIVELKTSGMLDNKWDDFGWGLERLATKRKLLIQAACNIISAREYFQTDLIEYYFYVASSTNDDDALLISVVFDERELAKYADMIEWAVRGIEVERDMGYIPYPHYKRCQSCPLGNYLIQEGSVCVSAQYVPEPITLKLIGG